MSTIKVNNIVPPNVGEGVSIDGLQMPTAGALSNRSLIINGAMTFDQRSNGSVFDTTGQTYGTCDRWSFQYSQASKYTGQQVSDGPVGFEKSLKATVTNAFTVGSPNYFVVEQAIEGYNTSSLAWGSADAKAISISFWVKASVTGTYSLAVRNADYTRTRVEEYTINTANTWEYKTITVPGDTTGTYNTTNGPGIRLVFDLGVGTAYSGTAGVWNAGNKFSTSNSVHLIETQGATWNITGVQLEVGSKATPFEHESYGQTLAKCQRYYYRTAENGQTTNLITMCNEGATSASGAMPHPVFMRAIPTVNFGSGIRYYSSPTNAITFTNAANRCSTSQLVAYLFMTGLTPGGAGTLYRASSTEGYIELSAEL